MVEATSADDTNDNWTQDASVNGGFWTIADGTPFPTSADIFDACARREVLRCSRFDVRDLVLQVDLKAESVDDVENVGLRREASVFCR